MPGHQVLVIACGATKHPTPNGPVRALDLYAGRQFKLAKRLEALGWSVIIMSAKHGLVPGHRPLSWYDTRMSPELSARAARKIRTNPRHSAACWTWHAYCQGADRIVFFGGAEYFSIFNALCSVFAQASHHPDTGRLMCECINIVGQGNGEHFSVLKALVAEEEAAALPLAA